MRLALLLLALGLSPTKTACAQAEPARVLVIVSDADLANALGEALRPWHVSLVRAQGARPGPTMPGSAERGRELAVERDASGAVWLSQSPEGWAIWVYDTASDRAMVRRLTAAPPFDEPTAAALALTVMAMLRHGATAPPRERVQAPVPAAVPREFALELAFGAEGWSTDPDAIEARAGLTLGYWPAAWQGVLGIELTARLGSGIGMSGGGLSGRLFDTRVLARGHLRGRLEERWIFGGLVGLGARVLVFDGSHPSGRVQGETRVVGVVEGSVEVGIAVDSLVVLVRVGATATPWLQSYEVNGRPVLSSNPVWPLAELGLELGF